VLPGSLRRDHILMAHEQNGLVAVLSLPVKQQIAVQVSLFQPGKHQGEQLLQGLMEAPEFFRLRHSRMGGGVILHHLRQLFRKAQALLLGFLRGVLRLFAGHQQGSDQSDQKQPQDHAGDQ